MRKSSGQSTAAAARSDRHATGRAGLGESTKTVCILTEMLWYADMRSRAYWMETGQVSELTVDGEMRLGV